MTFRLLALALAAATLAAGVLPVAASAQQYGGYNGYNNSGYDNGGYRRGNRNREARGIVANVDGTDLTLRNGRHVYLHRGTIIRPTGASIVTGQRIMARGFDAANGNLRANEVSVEARAFMGYRNGFDGYGRRGGY